jgi:hypothetical protein
MLRLLTILLLIGLCSIASATQSKIDLGGSLITAKAREAAAEFIRDPRENNAQILFDQYMDGLHRDALAKIYDVFRSVDFGADTQTCQTEREAIALADQAFPFSLALSALRLHCAEATEDQALASVMEKRARVNIARTLRGYAGQLPETHIAIYSVRDANALAWLQGMWVSNFRISAVHTDDQILIEAWFDNQKDPQQLWYFSMTGLELRAGLSQVLTSTPFTKRVFLSQSISLDYNWAPMQIALADYDATEQTFEALRAFYPEHPEAITAIIRRMLHNQTQCTDADRDALLRYAETKEPAALVTMALERVTGLCEPADLKQATVLLDAAQRRSRTSMIAYLLLMPPSNFRLSVPSTWIDQLRNGASSGDIRASYALAHSRSEVPTVAKLLADASQRTAIAKRNLLSFQRVDLLNAKILADQVDSIKDPAQKLRAQCQAAWAGVTEQMRACATHLNETAKSVAEGQRALAMLVNAAFSDFVDSSKEQYARRAYQIATRLRAIGQVNAAMNWYVDVLYMGQLKSPSVLGSFAARGAHSTSVDSSTIVKRMTEAFPDHPGLPIAKLQIELAAAQDFQKARQQYVDNCLRGKQAEACHVVFQADAEPEQWPENFEYAKRGYQDDPRGEKSIAAQTYGVWLMKSDQAWYDAHLGAKVLLGLGAPSNSALNDAIWVRCTSADAHAFDPKSVESLLPRLIQSDASYAERDTAAACLAALGHFDQAIFLADLALTQAHKVKDETVSKAIEQNLAKFRAKQRIEVDFAARQK